MKNAKCGMKCSANALFILHLAFSVLHFSFFFSRHFIKPGNTMTQPIRLAVLVSGAGTTLQNLIDRGADGRLCAGPAVVIAGSAEAHALERARQAGIAAAVVESKQAGSREEFSRQIFALCRE